jgi:hypothetical protein
MSNYIVVRVAIAEKTLSLPASIEAFDLNFATWQEHHSSVR